MTVRNQNFIFVTFCLVLALGLLQLRSVLEKSYGEEHVLREALAQAETQLEKEKIKSIVYQNQVLDMQVQIASLDLPERSPAAAWVQSLRIPASIKRVDLSALVFQDASSAFNDGKYPESINHLRELLEKFPASPKTVDARFLLAESLFRMNKLPECLEQVEEMISQYPENRLTGYLMLRMAQIFQSKNQNDKMSEVYRMVIRQFPQEEALSTQAKNLLKVSEASR